MYTTFCSLKCTRTKLYSSLRSLSLYLAYPTLLPAKAVQTRKMATFQQDRISHKLKSLHNFSACDVGSSSPMYS
jgi:hypothetical protein